MGGNFCLTWKKRKKYLNLENERKGNHFKHSYFGFKFFCFFLLFLESYFFIHSKQNKRKRISSFVFVFRTTGKNYLYNWKEKQISISICEFFLNCFFLQNVDSPNVHYYCFPIPNGQRFYFFFLVGYYFSFFPLGLELSYYIVDKILEKKLIIMVSEWIKLNLYRTYIQFHVCFHFLLFISFSFLFWSFMDWNEFFIYHLEPL